MYPSKNVFVFLMSILQTTGLIVIAIMAMVSAFAQPRCAMRHGYSRHLLSHTEANPFFIGSSTLTQMFPIAINNTLATAGHIPVYTASTILMQLPPDVSASLPKAIAQQYNVNHSWVATVAPVYSGMLDSLRNGIW